MINMDNLLNCAKLIIELAKKNNIDLRLFGRLAVAYHCDLKAIETKDIDLVGCNSQSGKIHRFFRSIGFNCESADPYPGGILCRFDNRKLKVDVYEGDLLFNFKIPKPYYTDTNGLTIPVTQLFLSKIMCNDFTVKDRKDVIYLLRTHKIGNQDDNETIRRNVLRQVWCFGCDGWEWADVALKNLKDVFDATCPDTDLDVRKKIVNLQKLINETKKTCCWLTGKALHIHNIKLVEEGC